MSSELRTAVVDASKWLGIDPVDFATAISYETAGTFDPWKKGPRTQWGQHRGLIQWGEPQRKKYGVTQETSTRDQVFAAARFLKDHGVQEGHGLLNVYAAINAGSATKIHASDANNGGAPGTVLDKVQNQMAGHKRKAQDLIGGTYNPSSNSLSPSNIELPLPNPKQVQRPEDDNSSIWQLQKDAYNVEQTLPWLFSGSTDTAPDPNWSLGTDRLRSDLEERGLDVERYAPRLAESHSEANYMERINSALEDNARVSRLAEAGLTGGALRVANSILDPVALVADIAASSVAPHLVLGNRARRTHRVLTAGFAGAAGGLAAEGVGYAVNPHRDKMDLFYGTVFGFGVGGAIGALQSRGRALPEATRLQRLAQEAVAEHEGAPLVHGSVGAARAGQQRNFLNDEAFEFIEDSDIAETFGSSVRGDLSAMLDKSKNPVTRALGGLVQDGTGKKGGAINAIAPSEERTRLREEWLTAFHRSYNPALKDYFEETGVSILDRPKAEAEFNRDVDSYIRDRSVGRDERYRQSVVRMGRKIADMQSEILSLAQNPFLREGLDGRPVFGFDQIKADKHYLARYWDPTRVKLAHSEYRDGTIKDLIYGSIRSANPDIAEDLLERLSRGFTKAVVDRAHGLDDLAVRRLGADSVDDLVKELNLGANDGANLKAFFEARAKGSDAGRDSRAKRRVLMDERFKLTKAFRRDGVLDPDGLSLDDLIRKDAGGTFSRYADQMSGMVALARFRLKDPVTGEMLVDGITSDNEFSRLIDIVRKRGADEGMDQKAIDMDVRRLEFAYSSIRGRPVSEWENTNFGWWSRAIRKVNFSRIMNQVGFAQVAEIGVTVGHLGIKASFSQVPALRRLLNENGETILRSGLADDLEAWIASGTDRLRHSTDYRFDDMTGLRDEVTGTWRDKAEAVLNTGNRATSEISGMTQANVMLERWTSASIIQKFANMAQRGGKGMNKARLADLGLDEDMTNRIMDMINTEGNFEFTKGIVSGRKVSRIHMDRWADKEAAESFRSAVFRMSRQLIQKNDIGNLMMWMSSPAAKMLMQFRTFMVGAYSKQTLKALNFRDKPAFMSMLASMMVAGAVYVTQSQIQSIGRSDRKDFLKRRLSLDKIGTAAFARSGASSVIPMLVDTSLSATGNDAVFSHTRTTGQASNIWFGNPATGGVDDLEQAGRSLAGILRSGDWSQDEARKVLRVIPFGNSIPLVMGLNALIGDLPEYAPRD